MTRNVDSSIINALAQSQVEPILAVEMLFDSGAVRLWLGIGEITINGNVFTGAGLLMNFSNIEETGDIQASSVTMNLSGISASIMAVALAEPYQGRICKVYFGSLKPTPKAVEIFSGFMDQMSIEENAETVSITLTVENELVDLERPRVRRFTNNDQQSRFPGDRGLEFIEDLQDKEIFWGRASP